MIARIDGLLAPYGGTGAYGRGEQISNRFLSDEIRGEPRRRDDRAVHLPRPLPRS